MSLKPPTQPAHAPRLVHNLPRSTDSLLPFPPFLTLNKLTFTLTKVLECASVEVDGEGIAGGTVGEGRGGLRTLYGGFTPVIDVVRELEASVEGAIDWL